ncbi:MAG: DMT family transporter [Chitinophagia bacterium]|nr:DMT family transporter [Chitinophagia bacterium]
MRKAYTQLHLAVLLAGLTGILGRLITLNELMIVCYRMLLTVLSMWVLFAWRKKIESLSTLTIAKIMSVGMIAALHWLTFYGAIKYANVSIALVCFAAIGFFTALFEPLILKQSLNGRELLLGLLTLTGVYIIFHFDTRYTTGIMIGLVSALLAALFPIFNRELLKKTNVESLLVWQQLGGFLFMAALIPVYRQFLPNIRLLPTVEDFLWLLVLSWICSVWAFQLSGAALKKLSAFTVNLSYNLEPVYGIVLAFVFFREDQLLKTSFFWGLGLILLALGLHAAMIFSQKKRA